MKLIAHRGYKTKFIKENTMEAFTNASNNDFYGIEFDVHKTRDGKLVVIHDSFIDRVSNGHGLVRDMTYEELSKYNFGSKESPSKIPLLRDVLDKYKDLMKIVELKCDVVLDDVLDFIDDKTYFMSFDTRLIEKLSKKYSKLKFGVLNYVLNSVVDYDLDMICILDIVATDEIVMRFLKKGIKVFIYGIVGKIDYRREYEGLYYIVEHKY